MSQAVLHGRELVGGRHRHRFFDRPRGLAAYDRLAKAGRTNGVHWLTRCARRVNRHAAAIGVLETDHVIDMRVLRQQLLLDALHCKRDDAGDALIVAFANALCKNVRQTDVLARLGGDEFCIIYPYTPLDKARFLVERLRKQLPRDVELTRGIRHALRWTGGLSAMHDTDASAEDVLWRADQAMLRAKEAGRNITLTYDAVNGHEEIRRVMTC